MGGSYYLIPCSILSTGKDRKTPQRYPDVPKTSWRISIRSMNSFQGLTPESPSLWHRPLAPSNGYVKMDKNKAKRTKPSTGMERDPLEDGVRCQMCTCKWCGYALREGSCWISPLKDGNLSIDAPKSFNDLPDVFTHPPHPQHESYLCELCGNDSHYAANFSNHTPELLRHFNSFFDDDDYKESTIPLNEIVSQIPPSITITPVLPTLEPEDSLIMGNEELSTIPEKESDEFIKSSVEDLVPIPSESKDTSESDSDCDLPSCDNFSSINIYEEKFVTFSNPLFDSNDDFTSSDDESLSDEDVLEDINIESKDSYVSNLDEPALLVTPLSNFNEDECFDPGGDVDEIEFLLHRDPSKISVAYILKGFTDEPPLEENDDLFDLESKENEWKKILYDASIDDLMTRTHRGFVSVKRNRLPIPDGSLPLSRDFAKPVKAIALPQDVPSTSDRHLIELEIQVQRLMEAHLAPTQPTQVNKITTSCEICSGPHDTQYCMENPEQAFVEYASSRTNKAGEGLVSEFMASQDARQSKFEANFKQRQSEMTNKIDTVLKAITDRIAGTLPSDMVKNPKLGTTLVLSARSYPNIDPQCSSHPSNSINAIKAHFKEATISQTSLRQPEIETEPPQPEEPELTLEDEFQYFHLNLPILEFLAYAPIYNAILDEYVERLELGKNKSAFVQGKIRVKMEDPGLFTLPCRLGDSKPFDTLADLGSCVNIIPLYLFKKLNIGLLEETDHIFGLADGTKSYPVGIVKDVEVHIGKLKLLNDFYVIDMKKDPETPLLVGRGFLATANAVIDCRMAKIAVGEGITRSVFGVKGVDLGEEEAPYWTTLRKRESYKPRPSSDGVGAQTPYYARKDFLDCHLPGEWEISRDAELNPFKDTLVFRRMVEFLGAIPINLKCNMWESEDLIKKPINWDKPPKDGDGAWHAKIKLIDPDGEEFTKTLQTIPTTRKLSERESPREIIDLDHFYDT
ncbi:MAK10-like protein [Tanacetum coccineum]